MECVTIPPRAPSFGGLWEAGVKSTKKHVRRQMGLVRLNFEEVSTFLTLIEAILNSRPLIALSTDSNGAEILTPEHFLIGAPMTALLEKVVGGVDCR